MAKIAILGYGNVGWGVGSVIGTNNKIIEQRTEEPVCVKYIFDKRTFPGDPYEKQITNDIEQIFNDSEVSIIVEALGGTEPAFSFAKRALTTGRSYVTSNKELVAAHGATLLQIAKDKNTSFLFEASVGGGVPIIRPLTDCLTADDVLEISGILNGTTNYILTKMSCEGMSFEDALADAQKIGYAESNPDADVNGFDAARKIAILLSMVVGQTADYTDIPTEGISGITTNDLIYAEKAGYSIKLIASAVKTGKGYTARVAPMLVPKTKVLSSVSDVLNGICVRGNAVGELMFIGSGAGRLPTASAIIADVIVAIKHPGFNSNLLWTEEKYRPADDCDNLIQKLIVLKYTNSSTDKQTVIDLINDVYSTKLIIEPYSPEEIAFITCEMTESEFGVKAAVIAERGMTVASQIRIMC